MSPDVVVIGGGAVGVSCALELARRGIGVTLFERSEELGRGCSWGNAGLLVPSHAAPLAAPSSVRAGIASIATRESAIRLSPRPALLPWLVRFVHASTPGRERAATALMRALSVASVELHAELAASGLRTGFERRGILNVYSSEERFAEGIRDAAAHSAAGLRHEVVDAAAAVELEPALAQSAGAIYYPDEAHADPGGFVSAVAGAAAEAGANFGLATEVRRLRIRRGRVARLETTHGDVAAGAVVVAAGAWSASLAEDSGLFLPLEAGKGYHVEFATDGMGPRIPLFFQEARVVATPLRGRLRIAGLLDLCGLDASIADGRIMVLERVARASVRTLAGRPALDRWAGLRPCTPDGLPALGRAAEIPNMVFATGHAMLGFTLAPLTARIVADLVAGRTPEFDVHALRPDRFRRLPDRVRRRRTAGAA